MKTLVARIIMVALLMNQMIGLVSLIIDRKRGSNIYGALLKFYEKIYRTSIMFLESFLCKIFVRRKEWA